MSSEQPTVSIVIPCYNEAEGLPILLERLALVHNANGKIEFVLVDNGSSDASVAIIQQAGEEHGYITHVRVDVNQGYGYGILQGLQAAHGDFIGWTHADMQTDPLDILRAFKILAKHPAPEKIYLKGHRYARPIAERIFTAGMSVLETLLFQTPMWDINAQPNIFHHSFHARWENPPHDFSLDLYAYAMAKRLNLKIIRFPVFFEVREFGSSHWNINWQAKLKFIKRTLNFSYALRKRWSK